MRDKRAEIIKKLIKEKGTNTKAFAEKIGLPYTTLRSMLERNIGNASVDNVIKVCRGLGISVEELERMANENINTENNEKLPELTEKDERDIQKQLKKILDGEDVDSALAAFDGKILDELDEEDRELLITSWENTLRLTKRIAKQKFTPKKYRK